MLLSELGCSTPVPRLLAQETGLVCAAVYGAVWRHCQMEEKSCRASLDTLGSDIGVDRATVMRSIKKLCDLGYLIDQTPSRRNAPHTYTLGKSVAECNTLENETVAERNALPETVAGNNTSSNGTVAHCNSLGQTVAESHLKKEESFKSIESNRESSESRAHEELNETEKLGKQLTDICAYDVEDLSSSTKQRLNQALNILIRKRASPEMVKRFKDEYWWGTSPPTPNQVTENWNRFIEFLKGKEPQKQRIRIT